MHDILRERLIRKIESLPEKQVYQILDYIEFLESKYGPDTVEGTSGLRRFAEKMEDKLRKTAISPATLREAFQLISAADRVLANVSSAGKKLMEELTPGGEELTSGGEQPASGGEEILETGESSQEEELPPEQDSPSEDPPTAD